MKLKLFAFAILVLATASCKNNYSERDEFDAKTAMKDSANYTEIQWLDTVKSFSPITEGQKLDLAFRFKNIGSRPLVIETVQPSCGCTVPQPPKEPIAPGQEGVIRGTFNSDGKVGQNHKTLTVIANTRPNVQHTLTFNVEVNKK